MRKIGAFICSLDGDDAAKTFQRDLKKFCEKTARQTYGVNEPHWPPHSNAVKSYVRENRKVFW